MRHLLLLLTAALLFSCSDNTEQKLTSIPDKQIDLPSGKADKTGAFYINKNENTYEIYSNRGELILEYTPNNTDSASLETLKYIYDTVKEFYNVEYKEDNDNKLRNSAI